MMLKTSPPRGERRRGVRKSDGLGSDTRKAPPRIAPTPMAQRRKFDSLEQEAFLNLWRTYDRLRSIEDETFSRHDLTAQQYNALRLLRAAAPGPTSKGTVPTLVVAERLVSRAPDITRLLDRLETRGLIRRERRPENRRVVEIGLTDAGRVLLDLMAAEVRECARRQLGHLSDRELRTLIGLLHKARAPHEADEGPWKVENA